MFPASSSSDGCWIVEGDVAFAAPFSTMSINCVPGVKESAMSSRVLSVPSKQKSLSVVMRRHNFSCGFSSSACHGTDKQKAFINKIIIMRFSFCVCASCECLFCLLLMLFRSYISCSCDGIIYHYVTQPKNGRKAMKSTERGRERERVRMKKMENEISTKNASFYGCFVHDGWWQINVVVVLTNKTHSFICCAPTRECKTEYSHISVFFFLFFLSGLVPSIFIIFHCSHCLLKSKKEIWTVAKR